MSNYVSQIQTKNSKWLNGLIPLTILVVFLLQVHSIGAAHYQQHSGFLAGSQQIATAVQQQQGANLELAQLKQQPKNQLDGLQQQANGANQAERSLLQLDNQPNQRPSNGGHSTRSSDREDPIFRYQGVALNSTSVKLVWSLLNGYYADFFDIEWGPIPDATHQFSLTKLNGSARDYTFHQLQPDTHYQFELHGYSGNHVFKPQLFAVHTPPANYASKNPQDFNIMPLAVKAEPKSNTSILISWSEPDKPSSIKHSIRVNIIRFYMTNPSNSAASETTGATTSAPPTPSAPPQYQWLNLTNSRESRALIHKLQPATEYAFAVKTAYYTPDMKRIFMQSGFSMDTLAKTLDIEPSAPRNFSIVPLALSEADLRAGQRGRLDLSWLPPESPNGQIKGYSIFWMVEPMMQEVTDGPQQWHKIDLGPATNSHQVGSLRQGATYYFKLKALNQRGLGNETETRHYTMPAVAPLDRMVNMPVPQSNILLVTVICFIAVVFCLFLLVSRLACKPRRKTRKGSLKTNNSNDQKSGEPNSAKLNGFASTNSGVSSTVAARVGTLARRRDNGKPDFWISAMDGAHQQVNSDVKSNISEKSNNDLNMAMVSLQRESPQFATTQLAPNLPDYRFSSIGVHRHHPQHEQNHLLQHLHQQTGHYHPGHYKGATLGYDHMDSATASALMTLSKRQQQHMQKYQIQFANTGATGPPVVSTAQTDQFGGPQAPSPHQQPPPPPPLYIEQQQQSLYGTHQTMANTRSLRLHRPTLYDPVSGSFLQGTVQPTLRSFQTGSSLGPVNQPQQLLQSHQAVINQLNNSTYTSLPLKHVSAVRPQMMPSLEDQIEMELAEKEHQEQQNNNIQQQQDQLQMIKQ